MYTFQIIYAIPVIREAIRTWKAVGFFMLGISISSPDKSLPFL